NTGRGLWFIMIICKTQNKNIAQTLKGGKRGIVDKIISYDAAKNKYKIKYSEGTEDVIPAKNLREGAPTKLSNLEMDYWSKQKNIPSNIKKWI
ncbi:hypothetical protein, partial [Bacteroides acidifaciens]|uniref:hypothetical protein n=1 Tax=Bacteroides acidifaciens TaxID=85831 RepID=UPI0025A5F1FC